MYKCHLHRVLRNPIKCIFLVIVILIPSLEVWQLMYQLNDFELTRTIYKLFFLSGAGRGHLFQVIYLWILPLYLLFIISDDTCYDEKIGYKYALLSRVGRSQYIKEKWIISFCFSFFIMFISLLLNMLLVYLVFGSRCSDIFLLEDMIGMTGLLQEAFLNYPLISYFIYMFFASVISGLIGMLGSAVSTIFRDKKYVYAITFLVWLIFIVMDESIMLVLQPYTEYPLMLSIKIFLKFIIVCGCSMLGAVIYEKKRTFE